MKWENFVKAGTRLPFYMHLFIEGNKIDVPRLIGYKAKAWVTVTEGRLTSVNQSAEEVKRFEKFLAGIAKDKTRQNKIMDNFIATDENILTYCRQLYYKDYQGKSNKELKDMLAQFVVLFRAKFGVYGMPGMIDLAAACVVPNFISKKIKDKDYAALIEADRQTDFTNERIALLKIVKKVKDRKLTDLFKQSNNEIISHLGGFAPTIYYQLESYVREYAWTPVTHHVQPMNLDQALDAIKETLKDRTAISELKTLISKPKKVRHKQKILMKKYKFTKQEADFVIFLRRVNVFKENRKAAFSKSLLWSYPLFQAIADNLKIDVVSLRQLNYKQIYSALYSQLSKKHWELIRLRQKTYVCQLLNNKITELNGPKAKKFIKKEIATDNKGIKVIKGMTAQQGKVKGKVRVIRLEHQTALLKTGEILVTSMTDPDMVPAMKKARAIVTDEGGITCHAAIVSRELKIPCVVGTKIATQVLKDGDRVEVDANIGIVRKI
ncbi:MAG: PEP-utilizing enzyme [Patescibacteria group bacterium]